MPIRTELPLKNLTYSNGEGQSLLPGGSSKSLRELYADGQLEEFKAKLKTQSGRGQNFLDILKHALSDKNPAKTGFVDALVQEVDALGDVSDHENYDRTPLFTAADVGNFHAVRQLVPIGGDRELLARRLEAKDYYASTALHVAVVAASEDEDGEGISCVSWLLERHSEYEVEPNAQDQLGRPALYQAAKHGNLALISEFLKHQCVGLDVFDKPDRVTPRDQILKRFPALGGQLSALPPDDGLSAGDELLRLLEHGDANSLRTFCEKVTNSDKDARSLRHNCGNMSLIQTACHKGYRDAVDALLAKSPALADAPSDTFNRTPPLLLAYLHADVLEVFRLRAHKQFQKRTIHGDTVLIQLIRTWVDDDERKDRERCLAQLLSKDYRDLVDINATNSESGDSALHFAALFRLSDVCIALLGAGAWLGGVNKRGYTPLDHLSASTLKTHLDSCVLSEGHAGSDERKIIFNYSCLRAPPGPAPVLATLNSSTPSDVEAQRKAGVSLRQEMQALAGVSHSKELCKLLKHPVLNSFLDYKWQQMHLIFYVNAILYAFFVIFITWYILEAGGTKDSETDESELTPGVFVLALLGFAYVACRELLQLLMDPLRYMREIENAMEVLLLVCAGFVLAQEQWQDNPEWLTRSFAAATVLLAWGEFVLLLGRHPKFATYVEMLKTVTWNFLKFLTWFAGLIVAFALCFYTLFRGEPSAEAFESLPLSSFKTLVMMTGELDLDNVPLDGLPYFSRPVFVVFVFIVIMVLLNLLNGLAVSDTQAIKDDAELVCCVSRVLMAERVESKLFDWLNVTRRICPCLTPLVLRIVRKVTVLPPSDLAAKGYVFPNAGCVLIVNKHKPGNSAKPGVPDDAVLPSMFCCLLERVGATACCKVSGKVMKRADAVLIERGTRSELDNLEERLLSKIAEATKELESRLTHRVEDMAREVTAAIREALDQRTTQL